MSEMTAEQFAQRAFDLGLIDARQRDSVWTDLGTREVSPEEFRNLLVRKELLTNYQVDRVLRGERMGFFYGDFKVLYLVGTGTFARVYRAVHRETGRIVAVKVLRKRFRDDPEQVEQFLREGEMGMALRHPNIVSIYEVESDRFAPYMVMDFVEGRNLREFVKIRRHLGPDVSLRLITDVVSGLAYAAEKGITHRDLKMSNILITSTGRARLVDFGLAAARGTTDEELADSPNARAIDYAALERGTGVRRDDPRSDIYFAGCIFYNMLTGVPPLFETRDRLKRLSVSRFHEVKPINEHGLEFPHYITVIVNKAMELDPSDRYQSPTEMVLELKLAGERLSAGDTGAPAPAESNSPNERATNGNTKSLSASLEGASRTIMIIESKMEMQDLLRERLKKRGYRVLVISSPGRALSRFEDEKVADAVLFCTSELGRDALDAFNRFGEDERTKTIPAILLADKRQRFIIEDAKLANHRVIMSMPLKVRQLRQKLVELFQTLDSSP